MYSLAKCITYTKVNKILSFETNFFKLENFLVAHKFCSSSLKPLTLHQPCNIQGIHMQIRMSVSHRLSIVRKHAPTACVYSFFLTDFKVGLSWDNVSEGFKDRIKPRGPYNTTNLWTLNLTICATPSLLSWCPEISFVYHNPLPNSSILMAFGYFNEWLHFT